jgi:single-strand DNA-binding protein
VAVDGRLEWSEWESQDGGKRSKVEVVADTVQFLGSRGDNEGGGGQSFRATTELTPDPVAFTGAAASDDDIPF